MKKYKTYKILLFSIIISLFFSTSVNAYNELSINVGLIAATTNVGFSGAYGDSCPVNLNDGYYINQNASNYCGITGMVFGNLQNSLGWGIGNGNYLKIYFFGYELRDKEDFHSVQNNGFEATITVDGTQYSLSNVGFNGGLTSQNSALFEYIFKYEGSSGTIQSITLHPGVALAPNELYRMGGIALYGVAGANADYSSQISDIIRQNEAIISKLGDSNVNDQTIINAINNQTQTERTEIENAASDAESAAESAGEEAESATQSLIGTAQSIIGAITETPATNCQINMNLGNINLGTMDFCKMWPQQIRDIINNITTIVLVIAVLLISYNLVQIYVAYITDYQEKT